MTGFTAIRDSRGITYVQPLPKPVTLPYESTPATHVCIWFNRTTRDWVVSLSNAQGQQIGSSEYVYSREDAEELARFLIIS